MHTCYGVPVKAGGHFEEVFPSTVWGGQGAATCQAIRMELSGVFNGAEINPVFFRLLGLALIKNFCEYRFLPPALEVVIQ